MSLLWLCTGVDIQLLVLRILQDQLTGTRDGKDRSGCKNSIPSCHSQKIGSWYNPAKRIHGKDTQRITRSDHRYSGGDSDGGKRPWFSKHYPFGIICADLSLNFPDFRAGERTFQLLAQVAGRAGRGAASGRVILQTYNPNHFSILSATEQNFQPFYDAEIGFRKSLNYPPFSRMVQIKISGKNKEKTRHHAQFVGDLCNEIKRRYGSLSTFVEILGPIEAPLFRIAKQYRWQILIKGLKVKPLHQFLRNLWLENLAKINRRDVKVILDVDPIFMMW